MSATYYIDGTDFATSTSVYTDIGLTTCAPDGYYRFGNVVRQQVGCVLLAQQACTSCPIPCGNPISANGGTGLYKMDIEVGADIGAIIAVFNPFSVPDGIRAIYDSVEYNKLVRAVGDSSLGNGGTADANDAGLAESNVGGFTIIGSDSNCFGPSTTDYDVFEYNGTSFSSTGSQESVTISAGNIAQNLDKIVPDYAVLVIPKTNINPSSIDIEVLGPCSGTAWDLSVTCPTDLSPGFSTNTTAQTAALDACGAATDSTLYAIGSGQGITSGQLTNPVTTTPGLRDLVYTDPNGATAAADGWYQDGSGGAIRVEDGIVAELNNCTLP